MPVQCASLIAPYTLAWCTQIPLNTGEWHLLGQLLINYKVNALAANPDWFAETL
jgi:hypothetical protein